MIPRNTPSAMMLDIDNLCGGLSRKSDCRRKAKAQPSPTVDKVLAGGGTHSFLSMGNPHG